METPQSAKESGHTNAENHKKEERKGNGLAIFLAEKLATPMHNFVYLCPNNLMRRTETNLKKQPLHNNKPLQQTGTQRVAT